MEVEAKLQRLSGQEGEHRAYFEREIRAIEEAIKRGSAADEILRKTARLQKELKRKYGELCRESKSLVSYLNGLSSQLVKELGQLKKEVAQQEQELGRCERNLADLKKSRQNLEDRINRLQPGLEEWQKRLRDTFDKLKNLPVPPLPEEKYSLLRDIAEAEANIEKIRDTRSRLERVKEAEDKLENAQNLLSTVKQKAQDFESPANQTKIGDLQNEAEKIQTRIQDDYEGFASRLLSAKKEAGKVLSGSRKRRKVRYVLYFLGLVVAAAFGYWLGKTYWM